MKKYNVVVEAVDGTHTIHKDLSYEDAEAKAEKWLGRKLQKLELRNRDKSTTAAKAVSDWGSVLFIEETLTPEADKVWAAINYSWKTNADDLIEDRKKDDITESYLNGLTDDQIRDGVKELVKAGWIKDTNGKQEQST
jgi:hypothetical protein